MIVLLKWLYACDLGYNLFMNCEYAQNGDKYLCIFNIINVTCNKFTYYANYAKNNIIINDKECGNLRFF